MQIVTFQQQVNAAVLQAAKIVNPASQQHALAAIQGVATIVSAILSLVQSISGKVQLAQMAAASGIKLAAVEPYLNRSRSEQIVAAHYGEPVEAVRVQMGRALQEQINAGF
jgi:membrane protein implicated in regulation of membrane protease activity